MAVRFSVARLTLLLLLIFGSVVFWEFWVLPSPPTATWKTDWTADPGKVSVPAAKTSTSTTPAFTYPPLPPLEVRPKAPYYKPADQYLRPFPHPDDPGFANTLTWDRPLPKRCLRPVKLAIGILTSSAAVSRSRIADVWESWGSFPFPNTKIHFFSDLALDPVPTVVTTGCSSDVNGAAGLPCRTRFLFEWLYREYPDYDYYLRAMDDTLVVVPNLHRLLSEIDPETSLTLGRRQVFRLWPDDWERYDNLSGQAGEIMFPQGGAGWLVSRGLMKSFRGNLEGYSQFFSWEGADDLAWGRFCMKAGFLFINHRAFFHNAPYVGPNCPYCDPGATQLEEPLTYHMAEVANTMPEVAKFIREHNYTSAYQVDQRHSAHSRWELCPCDYE